MASTPRQKSPSALTPPKADFLERLDSATLASFIQASQDAILMANLRRQLVYANPAALKLLGYSGQALLGRDVLSLVAPPYQEWVAARIEQNLQAPPGIFEIALVHSDGSWRYVRYSVLYLEIAGEVYGAATLHDLSDKRRHLRVLEALYQADEKLYSSLELDQVLQALVEVCVDLLGADKSCILVWDEPREHLLVRAQKGFSPEFVQVMNLYSGQGLMAQAAQTGEIVVVQDTHCDPRVARQVTDPEGIRAFMHLPVRLNGEIFGVFSIDNLQPHSLGSEEQRAFTALARRAASAIKNARLYAQAQGKAALEERQRLARNLHDSVSQAIYGIILGIRTARAQLSRNPEQVPAALDFVMNLAEAATAEMRALIFELHPESLGQEGLVSALAKQAAAVRTRHQLQVEARLGKEPRLSLEAKEALYRVAQEALNNIIKHAKAHQVSLRLWQENQRLYLEIQDDGIGFDPALPYPGHLGLVSMQERLERLGGALEIQSSPGVGTTIRARLALREGAA